MRAHERIIRDQFAQRTCTDCGVPYPSAALTVLAHRRSAWVVLLVCEACGHRGIFFVSFRTSHDTPAVSGTSTSPNSSNALPPQALSSSLDMAPALAPHVPDLPRASSSAERVPITAEDVTAMRDFLASFDGDFQRILAPGRGHSGGDLES